MNLKQNILVCRPGFSEILCEELKERFDISSTVVHRAAVALEEKTLTPKVKEIIFARQVLPLATMIESSDPKKFVDAAIKRLTVISNRANRQTGKWTIHCFAIDDDPSLAFALQLQKLILAQAKKSCGAFSTRYVNPEEFPANCAQTDVVVQVFMASPDRGYLSITSLGNGVLPFMGGVQPQRKPHGAPSRSASKLSEALLFLEKKPNPGETGVDLGAAPGGWTYVMAMHGADMIAIDHAELDLPNDKKRVGSITHLKENGLKYLPKTKVNWLCCDMVIGALITLEVLNNWFEADLMENFVVNVKLPENKPWPHIKAVLDLLDKYKNKNGWSYLTAKHLFHDRSEITLMGRKK